MVGNLIPKSMSLDEARDYVADARNWGVAEGQEELEFIPGVDDQDEVPIEQLRERVAADIEQLHMETPIEDESPRDQPRTDEEIELDIDFVCGPEAIAKPAEARHYAMLRLIEDLIDARTLLADLTAIVTAAARSKR